MPVKKSGDGFFGWLGRQIGHVKKAVQTKVEPEAEKFPDQLFAEELAQVFQPVCARLV